jgi:hypothetical protein
VPPREPVASSVSTALNRVLLAFNLVWIALLTAAVLASRARFAQVFADYEVELGAVERIVLHCPAWLLAAGAAALAALLGLAHGLLRSPLVVLQLHVAAVLLAVLAWSAYVGMLLVPMLRLLDALAGV